MKPVWLGLLLLLNVFSVQAGGNEGAVYIKQINQPVATVYDAIYKSLEDARFYVILEPNIAKNLARFSERWGEKYNKNNLSEIRSMVFCNAWYANQVSNVDPEMLGLCPLHLTLIEKNGKATLLFNRPSLVAGNSPAKELLVTIEAEVIAAIEKGLK